MDLGISQTTVARARDKIAEKFFPADKTSPEFLDRVSEVVERFHTRGFWVGAKSTFSIALPSAADGLLYLPYFLDSIVSARIDKKPIITRGPTYEFLYDGPGELDPDVGCNGAVIDRGQSPISASFPSTAGVLRFTAAAADAGKKIRVLGYDDSGDRVLTGGVPGEEVTLVDGTVDTTTTFSAIQGIQKEVTQASVTCHHVGTTNTLLVTMESFMELPLFRSYVSVVDDSSVNLIAYCKRRPIPVSSEEDYIMPGNLSALKLGLYALNYEEKNDGPRAKEFWRDAEEILNNEAVEYRAGAQEVMQYQPWGAGVSGLNRTN